MARPFASWRAHAQVQRLGAAEREPRIERTGHGAGGIVDELQPRGEVVVAQHGDAADHVAVSVQILRRRVVDDVRAELERPLEERRREGVVDDQERVGPVRDLRRSRARSVMRISGFVGVSTNTMRVAGVIASAMRCGSRVST